MNNSLKEYMKRMQILLKNSYKESCTLIAFDIAFLLLGENKKPTIIHLRHSQGEVLVPVFYNGKVKWGGHSVCFCDGLVYDPMAASKPIPLELYLNKTFGDGKVVIDRETVTAYIQERQVDDPRIYFTSGETLACIATARAWP